MTRAAVAEVVSPHELQVANVLRERAWRWLSLGEVDRAADMPRRSVRHHLSRLVAAGLVERADDLERTVGRRWRWSSSAPQHIVECLSLNASVLGADLAAIGEPPSTCPRGHSLDDAVVVGDGARQCARCGRWCE